MAYQAMQSGCYDAIVVVSGARGGWAAKKLTESGMRDAIAVFIDDSALDAAHRN